MNDAVERFVYRALKSGAEPEEIKTALLDNGWESGEVEAALAAHQGTAFGLPVPKPKPYVSAAEAFLMLLMFASLYVASWSLGALLFEIIEHRFPEGRGGFSRDVVRWAIAWLVVSFPLFFWLARKHHSATRSDAVRKHSPMRKWLTYFTLLIASLTMMGDVVVLLYNILSGEITVRFLLKVFTLGLIAGGALGYYAFDLRQAGSRGGQPRARTRVWGVAAAVTVVAAIVGGVVVSGSPARARANANDGVRLQNLQNLSRLIENYHDQKGQLPASLPELQSVPSYGSFRLADPAGRAYEYQRRQETEYTLCAVFEEPTWRAPGADTVQVESFWQHGAGRHCFDFDVSSTEEDG